MATTTTTTLASSRPPSRSTTMSSPQRTSSSLSKTGWYNSDPEHTSLEKITERLNTYAGRFERFLGLCANNIVMALFRPTPLVVFLFHPLLMIVWGILALCWLAGWVAG